jgi:O-antigen/teichoic acid export membrane protein
MLNTFGIIDFGVYNVVTGFVLMFGFLNSAMSSSIQRFLSYEIGLNRIERIKRIFVTSFNIQFILSLLVLLIAESLGIWFLNNKLNIPKDQVIAVNVVYQFSILSLVLNMLTLPYNALIIAYEKMNIYAWMSIIEISFKLGSLFIISYYQSVEMELYSSFLLGISLLNLIMYRAYCKKNILASSYNFNWDKKLTKELVKFSGWNLWGSASLLLYEQGVNILLNIFYGPLINAARSISFQIGSAISTFSYNFQTAIKPQIIKSYAKNDYKGVDSIVTIGSKFTFYMLLVISLPVFIETNSIMKIWLKSVPEFSVIFTQVIILSVLIDSLSATFISIIHATGKIGFYQLVIGGLNTITLPLSYLFIKLGYGPLSPFIISVFISICILIMRIYFVNRLAQINLRKYFFFIIKIIIVVPISLSIPFIIKYNFPESLSRLTLTTVSSITVSIVTIFYLAFDRSERSFIINFLNYHLIKRFSNKKLAA